MPNLFNITTIKSCMRTALKHKNMLYKKDGESLTYALHSKINITNAWMKRNFKYILLD